LSKLHHYRIYKYLPIQANRDVDNFRKEWNDLLVRKCLESEEVSYGFPVFSFLTFLQKGINTSVYELYKNMKEGQMTYDEFSHTLDEIQFANLGKRHEFFFPIPRAE
jgi:hypothetical protein